MGVNAPLNSINVSNYTQFIVSNLNLIQIEWSIDRIICLNKM